MCMVTRFCPYYHGASGLTQWPVPLIPLVLWEHWFYRMKLFGRQNLFFFFNLKFSFIGGWRDGSVVKSTHCSCRRPEFSSKHLVGTWYSLIVSGLCMVAPQVAKEISNCYVNYRQRSSSLGRTVLVSLFLCKRD